MAEVKPLKLTSLGAGAGALAEFGEGDSLPKAVLPALEPTDVGAEPALELVSQAAAEAGQETERRAWSALRVRQAIAAFLSGITSAFGRSLVAAADAAAGRTALGLGNAATATVTQGTADTSSGRITKVGDYGMPLAVGFGASNTDLNSYTVSGFWSTPASGLTNAPSGWPAARLQMQVGGGDVYATQIVMDTGSVGDTLRVAARRMRGTGTFNTWREFWHSGNLNPNQLMGYTLSTLPSPAANPRMQVYVSDLFGQPGPCYSDGANWRRVSDNSIAN